MATNFIFINEINQLKLRALEAAIKAVDGSIGSITKVNSEASSCRLMITWSCTDPFFVDDIEDIAVALGFVLDPYEHIDSGITHESAVKH